MLIFLFLIMLIQPLIADESQVWIREAVMDDRAGIVALYKRSSAFYKSRLLDGCYGAELLDTGELMNSIHEGFAFIAELVGGVDDGKIVAFLIKHRPVNKAYRHILDHGLSGICPEYKRDMLLICLYRHLQNRIEAFHPDILRVEGCCHACAHDAIDLFYQCGFSLSGTRENAVLLSPGSFADELIFVWNNRNFMTSSRRSS